MAQTGTHVLVVEHDAETREWMEEILSDVGYHVHAYATSEEAMKGTREHPVDLALVDVRLPGKSGVELLSQLKTEGKTRAAAVSELFAMAKEAEQKGEAGKTDPAETPERVSNLLGRVRRLAGW